MHHSTPRSISWSRDPRDAIYVIHQHRPYVIKVISRTLCRLDAINAAFSPFVIFQWISKCHRLKASAQGIDMRFSEDRRFFFINTGSVFSRLILRARRDMNVKRLHCSIVWYSTHFILYPEHCIPFAISTLLSAERASMAWLWDTANFPHLQSEFNPNQKQ